jgi:flagellar biosynthesis protein FlhG
MPVIIPIASGKGGVGKTLTAIHSAITLAQLGKTTILIDSDMGGSNAHTYLGIKNRNPGIGSIIHRQETHIEDLILETRIPKLFLIPGDGQLTGTANPPFWIRRRLEKEINKLVCDYVVIDLGAGTGTFILDMFLLSRQGIVVTTPEIPALLNAYGFIKSTAIRIFQQHTKNKSPEGKIANEMPTQNIDSTNGIGLDGWIERIKKENPEAANAILEDLKLYSPQILLNMGTHQKDLSLGSNIQRTCQKHLGIDARYIGFIPWFVEMRNLINQQKLLTDEANQSPIHRAFLRLGHQLLEMDHTGANRPPVLTEDDLVDGLFEE